MKVRGFAKCRFKSKMLQVAVVSGFLYSLAAGIPVHASVVPDEWDEVFDTARAVLATLPDAARIDATIKDPALRDAVERAYRALKACAKVNKGQSVSQKKAFVAEFDSAFKAVQNEVAKGAYRDCASTCATDGSKCEKDCESAKKKVCGCKMTQFGCVMKCIFG